MGQGLFAEPKEVWAALAENEKNNNSEEKRIHLLNTEKSKKQNKIINL